ncbi:MAG TPA: hypothetical protein VGH91_04460 [Gammaproteobacteria bacterium]|jgi:hypothetical protein
MSDAPTPSSQATASAVQTFEVVDKDKGRKITLKKPSVIAQYRLIGLLGGDLASNQVFVAMALPLIYVSAIDGEPVITPVKYAELEALIQRLDEGGVAAVSEGVIKHFGKPDTDLAAGTASLKA